MSAPSTPHPALAYRCPFCHSDPGQQCRAHRGRGHALDRPHSRRIALTRPAEERRPAAHVNALCCVCGNLRTVSSDYSRWQDPNHASSAEGTAQGWRRTQSLKCNECGEPTRHALLYPADGRLRNWDELRQRIALGDPDTSTYPMSEEGIERLRREYREMPFPRNPNLKHRFYIADAQKVWDEGRRDVIALCGEPDTIETDPKTWGTSKADNNRQRNGGYLVAEQLSDIEYTDLDTGLEWIDMDCVDCCRVANNNRRARRREHMVEWLVWLYAKPERVPDEYVDALIEVFEATQRSTRKKDADR